MSDKNMMTPVLKHPIGIKPRVETQILPDSTIFCRIIYTDNAYLEMHIMPERIDANAYGVRMVLEGVDDEDRPVYQMELR